MTKSAKGGVGLRKAQLDFADWCLLKLGFHPPTKAERQRLYLRVFAGINNKFYLPL